MTPPGKLFVNITPVATSFSEIERARRQLDVTGTTAAVGESNLYAGDERVGATVRQAYDDARAWVRQASSADGVS